jgi:hypothetical protein
MSGRSLEQASADYDEAEATYIGAIRTRADCDELASAARTVASVAAAFNSAAYEAFHRGQEAWMPLDQLTERTEVSSELWADIAAAYDS